MVGSAGRGRVLGQPQGAVHGEKNPNDIDQVPPTPDPTPVLGTQTKWGGFSCHLLCDLFSGVSSKKGLQTAGSLRHFHF